MLSAIAARKAAAANAPPSLLPSPTSSPPLIAPIGDKPPHVLSKPRTQPQAVKTTEATSGRSTPKKTKKNKRALEESEDSTQRRPARHRPNRPAEVSNLAGPSTPSRRRPYSPSRPLDAVENDSDEGMLGIDVEPEHEVVRGWYVPLNPTHAATLNVLVFTQARNKAIYILSLIWSQLVSFGSRLCISNSPSSRIIMLHRHYSAPSGSRIYQPTGSYPFYVSDCTPSVCSKIASSARHHRGFSPR